jgi:phosphate transport system permease protein
MTRTLIRLMGNQVARVAMYLCSALALIPLALVLIYVISNGLPAVEQPTFLTAPEHPVGIPGGGVANALIGSLMMVGLASALAIPVGVVAGVHLAEYGRAQFYDLIRLCVDALVAAPSIAIGLFAYAVLVAPAGHFSGYAGAIALAVLMLPVVVRTTEGAVSQIDPALRESGLALGLPQWRVSLQLILPAAVAGVLTGALLAVARAAGESAPLLFASLGNSLLTANMTQPMNALPLVVYHDALTPYPELQTTAWGAALVLVVVVLAVHLFSRAVFRRRG